MSNKRARLNSERTGPAARKRRAITVAGALIIFFTFVVKEAVRDYLKDLRDSLGSASNLFALEQDINAIQLHVVKLDEGITAASIRQATEAERKTGARQHPVEIRNTIALLKLQDGDLRADFDRIRGLVDKMPPGMKRATQKTFAQMDETLSKFHEEAEKRAKALESGPQDSKALALAQLGLGFLLLAEVPISRWVATYSMRQRSRQTGWKQPTTSIPGSPTHSTP